VLNKQEAIELAEKLANEVDLDNPTKKRQAVYDKFTQERTWGWIFYCTACENLWVHGRDPEPQDAPPILVNRVTSEVVACLPGDDPDGVVWSQSV
jgi:hypothetical protein